MNQQFDFDCRRPHLASYGDLFEFQLEIDLLDAMELRLMAPGHYLAHHNLVGIDTTFDAMLNTRKCQALASSLYHLGVPIELIEVTVCEWILQYVIIHFI